VLAIFKRFSLVLFLGGCAFLGGSGAMLVVPRLTSSASAEPSPVGGKDDLTRTSDRFESVARKVSPAVVAIQATKPPSSPRSKTIEESGSGILIRVDGQRGLLVLTNNHVIAGATANQITVNLSDDRVLRPTQFLADPETDVALLRLEGIENVTNATLGDSDTVKVGQWVLAIGSPFGLNQTVTHGIISARERGQVSLGSTIRIKDFLQTDAAINPGSSGGPLVNLDGEVIGINTAIASNSNSSSGVAFSIPINLVKKISKQLLEKGSVARGYLGMQLAGTFEASDALKLGLDRSQGALVETIYPDTPASVAGLRVNDVILQVNGVPVRNETHLINVITATPAGTTIHLQVWRERKTVAVDAVVGDWTKAQTRFKTAP
jgi:S1-C subfamily serine protease